MNAKYLVLAWPLTFAQNIIPAVAAIVDDDGTVPKIICPHVLPELVLSRSHLEKCCTALA